MKDEKYFLLIPYFSIVAILIGTLVYALFQNWNYILALSQIFGPVRTSYTPIHVGGIIQPVLATAEIIVVGTLSARAVFPLEEDGIQNSGFFLKISALGFGFCIIGLVVTLLSDFRLLTLASVQTVIIAFCVCLLGIQKWRLSRNKRDLFDKSLLRWLRSASSIWQFSSISEYEPFEIAGFSLIAVIAVFIYYNAIMFPVVETDALIYHASAASIAYYNHGMPLIDGVGVGLGMSSNYPLLYSYLGTFYYLAIGGVQDVYLRALTPTMWLLSVLTTYLIGKKLANRKLGILAALLVALVPSYASYGFQATDETTVTFFLALGFLFFIHASDIGINHLEKRRKEDKEQRYYIVGAGIAFGAACLTTYQALYFLAPLLLLAIAKIIQDLGMKNRALYAPSAKNFGMMFALTAMVGLTPYLRNAILLHDPVYPYMTSIFPAEHFSGIAMGILKNVAYSLVDPSQSGASQSFVIFLIHLSTFPSLYPLNFTLVGPAVAFLWASRTLLSREKSALTLFIVVPAILIILSPAPFVRYFWLILPYAAVAVAMMIAYADDFARGQIASALGEGNISVPSLQHTHHSHNSMQLARGGHSSIRVAKTIVPLLIAVMVVFPCFVVLGGQAYTFIPFPNSATQDYLRYTTNPGMNSSAMLLSMYGSDVQGWGWLSSHISYPQRLAMFESRVYYMNFALTNPSSMFYLDGVYAAPLYSLKSTNSVLQFLASQGVSYVFVRSEDWNSSLLESLPLSYMLGSPNFPLVFRYGTTCVFKIGPITDDAIIAQDGSANRIPAYALNFSKIGVVDGRLSQNITQGSDAPRLLVENDRNLVNMNITYLDSGIGELDFNVFNPETRAWVGYYVVQKHDTGQWRSLQLLVPTNLVNNYTDFGLHADSSNFTISNISFENIDPRAQEMNSFTLFGGPITMTASNESSHLMIYLPMLGSQDAISLRVNASSLIQNCSIEIIKGYVQLGQNRSISSMSDYTATFQTGSTKNTSALVWKVSEPGAYTILLVTWNTQQRIFINSAVSVSLSITSSQAVDALPEPIA